MHARKQRNKAKNVDPYLKNSEDGLECMRHRSTDGRQSQREGLASGEWIHKSKKRRTRWRTNRRGRRGMNGRCPVDVLGLCGTGNDNVDSAGRAEWADDGDNAGLQVGGPDDLRGMPPPPPPMSGCEEESNCAGVGTLDGRQRLRGRASSRRVPSLLQGQPNGFTWAAERLG